MAPSGRTLHPSRGRNTPSGREEIARLRPQTSATGKGLPQGKRSEQGALRRSHRTARLRGAAARTGAKAAPGGVHDGGLSGRPIGGRGARSNTGTKENNGSSIQGRTRSWKESRDGQSTLKSRRGNACDLSNNGNSMAGSDALFCVENKNL